MKRLPLDIALERAWPPEEWEGVTVLVAVSGGADSVALLYALSRSHSGGEGGLVVAHLNHGLRGGESDADERFVRDLASELELPFESARLSPSVLETGPDGLESAARKERYRFLTTTAERLGARYVACGHTADDQIETILHRIVRGTGISGLSGIPRHRRLSEAVTLVRPFLEFRRSELTEYLTALGQSFRDDSSNADCRFTRNRIRHDLLPHLADHYNPAISQALLRLGRLAAEAQDAVNKQVRALMDAESIVPREDGVLLRRDKLSDQSGYLLRELLIAVWRSQRWPMQAMGFEQWEQLALMLHREPEPGDGAPRRQTYPGRILAEERPDGLLLQPL